MNTSGEWYEMCHYNKKNFSVYVSVNLFTDKSVNV